MLIRRSTLIVLALLLAPFVLVGCSSNESGTPVQPVDTAPPMAPVMNEARAVGSVAILHWARNTETDLAGYNIYLFAPDPATDVSYQKLNSQLVIGTSYEAQGLTPGTIYYFKVTAVDRSGNESAYSQPIGVYVLSSERSNEETRLGEFSDGTLPSP